MTWEEQTGRLGSFGECRLQAAKWQNWTAHEVCASLASAQAAPRPLPTHLPPGGAVAQQLQQGNAGGGGQGKGRQRLACRCNHIGCLVAWRLHGRRARARAGQADALLAAGTRLRRRAAAAAQRRNVPSREARCDRTEAQQAQLLLLQAQQRQQQRGAALALQAGQQRQPRQAVAAQQRQQQHGQQLLKQGRVAGAGVAAAAAADSRQGGAAVGHQRQDRLDVSLKAVVGALC